MLIGNVGREPEVRYVDRDMPVANVRLATNEGEGRTEWHNVVLFKRLAEIVEQYVHKGDKLYVEGKLRTRTYEDTSGVRRTQTDIYADQIELLTPRKE